MPRYRGARWYVPLAIMLAVSAVLIAVSWLLPSLGGGHPIYARDGEIGNFFNVDEEGNLPTWWSTIQLGGGAILYLWGAWLSRASRTRGTVAWVLVALVLFAMSLDEATQLHEQLAQLSGVIASPFGNEYAWLAVGIPVAIGVVALPMPASAEPMANVKEMVLLRLMPMSCAAPISSDTARIALPRRVF